MLIDYIASASADIYADRQMRLIIENGQHETVGMVDLINFDPRHLRAEIGIVIKDEVRGKDMLKKQFANYWYILKKFYTFISCMPLSLPK